MIEDPGANDPLAFCSTCGWTDSHANADPMTDSELARFRRQTPPGGRIPNYLCPHCGGPAYDYHVLDQYLPSVTRAGRGTAPAAPLPGTGHLQIHETGSDDGSLAETACRASLFTLPGTVEVILDMGSGRSAVVQTDFQGIPSLHVFFVDHGEETNGPSAPAFSIPLDGSVRVLADLAPSAVLADNAPTPPPPQPTGGGPGPGRASASSRRPSGIGRLCWAGALLVFALLPLSACDGPVITEQEQAAAVRQVEVSADLVDDHRSFLLTEQARNCLSVEYAKRLQTHIENITETANILASVAAEAEAENNRARFVASASALDSYLKRYHAERALLAIDRREDVRQRMIVSMERAAEHKDPDLSPVAPNHHSVMQLVGNPHTLVTLADSQDIARESTAVIKAAMANVDEMTRLLLEQADVLATVNCRRLFDGVLFLEDMADLLDRRYGTVASNIDANSE